jgi:hypothetical protein
MSTLKDVNFESQDGNTINAEMPAKKHFNFSVMYDLKTQKSPKP